LISGNPELGLRSFLFREEHDGQTPRPASYSKVRAGYFNRLLATKGGKKRQVEATNCGKFVAAFCRSVSSRVLSERFR
jgi:hypothetical protein